MSEDISVRSDIKDVILDYVTEHFHRITGKHLIKDNQLGDIEKLKSTMRQKAVEEGMRHITIDERPVLGKRQLIVEYYIVDHKELIGFVDRIVDSLSGK